VLQAATRLGAQAAGLDSRAGTLEPGKWADLIVVEGDVLAAPATVVRPSWVILNGEIVRRPTESATDSSTSFGQN
jgi:imidazolonepropionase-like amidohydrolase